MSKSDNITEVGPISDAIRDFNKPRIRTMRDLLAEFAPDKTVLDSGVTRAIAKAMRAKGYIRKRMRWQGKTQWVWTNEDKLADLERKVRDSV